MPKQAYTVPCRASHPHGQGAQVLCTCLVLSCLVSLECTLWEGFFWRMPKQAAAIIGYKFSANRLTTCRALPVLTDYAKHAGFCMFSPEHARLCMFSTLTHLLLLVPLMYTTTHTHTHTQNRHPLGTKRHGFAQRPVGHHNFQDSVSSVGDVLQGHQIGSTTTTSSTRCCTGTARLSAPR